MGIRPAPSGRYSPLVPTRGRILKDCDPKSIELCMGKVDGAHTSIFFRNDCPLFGLPFVNETLRKCTQVLRCMCLASLRPFVDRSVSDLSRAEEDLSDLCT